MTPIGSLAINSLRFLACSGLSTTARALLPRARIQSRHFSSIFERSTHEAVVESFQSSPCPDAEETLLVVGDGDLSYSASIASETADSGIFLIASVLETQPEHQKVYRNSQEHVQSILSHELHQVLFGTDATQLHKSFPCDSFDQIQFNFPHWRGKSNNRYNRELLSNFLQSASQVLKKDGEIQVALRKEQGGVHAKTLVDWRLSWKAAELAADAGLLLSRLDPFQPNYDVSSYRGKDKLFHVGDNPERYIFTFPPHPTPIDPRLQLCYRHEIRIKLDPDCLQSSPYSEERLLNDDIVLNLARKVAPEGISVELPARAKVTPPPGKNPDKTSLLVFLMVYGGEQRPLTRSDADQIRADLEEITMNELGFPLAKRGRMVSHPFPYPVLEQLVRNHD